MVECGDFVTVQWNEADISFLRTPLKGNLPPSVHRIEGVVASVFSRNSILLIVRKSSRRYFNSDALMIDDAYIAKYALPQYTHSQCGVWVDPAYVEEIVKPTFKVGDSVELKTDGNNLFPRDNPKALSIFRTKILGTKPHLENWETHYAVEWDCGYKAEVAPWYNPLKHANKRFHYAWASDFGLSGSKVSGMNCMNRYCNERSPWAESANCPNGVYLCYSCRTNPITYSLVMSAHERNP